MTGKEDRIQEQESKLKQIVKILNVSKEEFDEAKRCIIALGIPRHMDGYTYIIEGLLMIKRDPEMMKRQLRTVLYKKIGEIHGSSYETVGMTIKNVIDYAFQKKTPYWNMLFEDGKKPKVKEFFPKVFSKLRVQSAHVEYFREFVGNPAWSKSPDIRKGIDDFVSTYKIIPEEEKEIAEYLEEIGIQSNLGGYLYIWIIILFIKKRPELLEKKDLSEIYKVVTDIFDTSRENITAKIATAIKNLFNQGEVKNAFGIDYQPNNREFLALSLEKLAK